jgi:hypothetical protein
VRKHSEGWAVTKKINLYNLPETKGQKNKTSQTAQFFLSGIKIFPECPKSLGINQKFLQPLSGARNYQAPSKKFPKCPKLLSMSSLQECPNVLGRNF